MRDKRVINFGKISRNQNSIGAGNHQNKLKMLQKQGSKCKNFFPGHLFRAGRLSIWGKFPPRTFIQDRTCIRDIRVHEKRVCFNF